MYPDERARAGFCKWLAEELYAVWRRVGCKHRRPQGARRLVPVPSRSHRGRGEEVMSTRTYSTVKCSCGRTIGSNGANARRHRLSCAKNKQPPPTPPPITNATPCPRCLGLAKQAKLRTEMVQPFPEQFAPLAVDRSGKCCYDCASADTLMRFAGVPSWEAARIAVGNDRQEQLRLPGALLGLVKARMMRPSQPGDLEKHFAWLEKNQWFHLPTCDSDNGSGDDSRIGQEFPCHEHVAYEGRCWKPGMIIEQEGHLRARCPDHGLREEMTEMDDYGDGK